MAFAPSFAYIAGRNTTLALFVAAPHAGRRLARAETFTECLHVIERIAEYAPESVSLLLDRSGRLLDSLNLRSFETIRFLYVNRLASRRGRIASALSVEYSSRSHCYARTS
jgi:hypothetical protein